MAEHIGMAIGSKRRDRLDIALTVAEPGDVERLCEVLGSWDQ
jgi:hypothetical protein